MNSCGSTLLSACAPPFRIFIWGTGSRHAPDAAQVTIQRHVAGTPPPPAPTAIETARIAFAPSFDLFGVPSI